MMIRQALLAAAVLALPLPAAGQAPLSWDAPCAAIADRLEQALAEAPTMAEPNALKVERLLEDARQTADDRSICMVKLERAHTLVRQAYDDAGRRLDAMRDGSG